MLRLAGCGRLPWPPGIEEIQQSGQGRSTCILRTLMSSSLLIPPAVREQNEERGRAEILDGNGETEERGRGGLPRRAFSYQTLSLWSSSLGGEAEWELPMGEQGGRERGEEVAFP